MTRLLDGLFRGIEILMAVLLLIMIVTVFANVVLRYAFDTGLTWSAETARLAFIYLVYLGTIGAYRDNQHLGVDTLLEKTSPKVANVLYAVIQVIVIWVMVLLALGSWQLAVQTMDARWVATQYPTWLVSIVGAITGGAICILALSNLYRLIVRRESVEQLSRVRGADAEDPAHSSSID